MSDLIEGWCITFDALNEIDEFSRKGYGCVSKEDVLVDFMSLTRKITVTADIPAESIKDAITFELYDADEILYYRGVISYDWVWGDCHDLSYHPLIFGEADAGCTIMKSENPNGEMITIY